MKCVSCEVEINPKWRHAVDINVCPFCGEVIMQGELKELLTSLRNTLDKLQEYPDQLNDWLLSNFNFIKTDSEDLPKYLPKEYVHELKKNKDEEDFLERKKKTIKVKTENGEEEVLTEQIQSDEKNNSFFERAEVVRTGSDGNKISARDKTEHIKKMLQQIKKTGSQALVSENGEGIVISPEMMESADPNDIAEMQSMLSDGEIASSLPDNGDEERIPAAVLAMAKMANGKKSNNNAKEDLLKLRDMQSRAYAKFESGENRGTGGFSRAGS